MNEEEKERLGILINEIVNGSLAAIDELYKRMYRIMFSVAFLHLGNKEDSADIVHDAFYTIVRKAHKFGTNKNAYAWINTITKRTALNHLKKWKRRSEVSLDCIGESGVEDNYDSFIVRDILNMLDDKEREVIVYKYWYGLSLSEIGKIINKPKSSTLYYINSIENKIRKKYDKILT